MGKLTFRGLQLCVPGYDDTPPEVPAQAALPEPETEVTEAISQNIFQRAWRWIREKFERTAA